MGPHAFASVIFVIIRAPIFILLKNILPQEPKNVFKHVIKKLKIRITRYNRA